MSKVATLKKKAADLEKKSPDKVLPVYVELLAAMEKEPGELDVALYNRVGDLMVKGNKVADAVNYYEKAVDYYVDGGFFNNAIALCNKILRSSPGRSTVYYKLGKINAHKGFKADAKQNFLEYADRMQKVGQVDEAFRALAEFADLCPDQTDIRLMLADQLAKANKTANAVEQLQILHEQLHAEGREGEAEATATRIKALDPTAEPRTGGGQKASDSGGDLVFLDLGDSPEASAARRSIAHRRATSAGMKALNIPPLPKPTPAPAPVVPPPPLRPSAATPQPPRPSAATPPPPRPSAATRPPPRPSAATPLPPRPSAATPQPPRPSAATPQPPRPSAATPQPPPPAAAEPPPPPPPPPPPRPSIIAPEPVIEVHEPVAEEPVFDISVDEFPVSASLDESGTGSLLDLESKPLAETSEPSPFGGSIEFESTAFLEPTPPAEEAGPEIIVQGDTELSMPDPEPEIQVLDVAVDLPEPGAGLAPEPAAPEVPLEAADLEDLARVDAIRPSTKITAKSVKGLKKAVDENPEDWGLHRELAEALLETGDREEGMRELETAMLGFERIGDLATAMSVTDEIVRLEPSSIKYLQKKVELSYRSSDRAQLVESYLALADAMFRTGQVDKSRSIYQRVLELSPDDVRAQAALSTMPEPEPPPPPPKKSPAGPRPTATRTPAPLESVKPTPLAADAFVNLGDWLRDDESPKDTRMVVAEEEPTGNEEADFADMLKKFKQGVAENVEAEDYQSHYDLGVAYKEMGLVDEAIAEFQKALRGPTHRVRTYEAIGQCFIEKNQNQMAATILGRALTEKDTSDELLVGVLYLLGRANEALGKIDDAVQFYQRVFIVDIAFQDVSDRLNALENAAR